MNRITLCLAEDEDWNVWLDADTRPDPDGVLIGVGMTRDEAIADADKELRDHLEALQKLKERD